MKFQPEKAHAPFVIREARSGFAIVVALSLMAFLVLLLLGISSLVRVEIAAASGQVKHLEARSAALLGLQLALGELQTEAGPDQRLTARAVKPLLQFDHDHDHDLFLSTLH